MLNSAVVATHSFSPGTSQALRDYLLKEGKDVLFIEHALFGNIFTWSIGAIDTLWQVIKKRKRYDLYVGSNNLNAFLGIILRKIGLVKKVIFFTPDYSLNRFNNFLLDNVYLWFDFFCLRNADLVWNSSSIMPVDLMALEREKRGVPKKYRQKQIPVPDGTDEVELVSLNKINRYDIVFVGHLKEGMGLNLLIDVFSVICREIPQAKLIIIGSGPMEKRLREKARNMNIEFTGFIGELSEVYNLISKCAVAVAPYEEGTISQYTDPGKVKLYLSVGLPMVITNVPRVALEIEREKCGLVINYSAEGLTNALLALLRDDSLLRLCRQNALALANKYRWHKIFSRALSYIHI